MPYSIPPEDALNAWDRLANGKPLGKKVVIPYTFDAAGVNTKSAVSVLQLHGETDLDAQQLSVLISPPRTLTGSIPASGEQNMSGSQSNEDSSGPFPDLYAEIEWGIGGVSNKALVDMMNGCCVNVCASFLRIRMGAASTGSEDDGGGIFECSAYVGPGWPKQPNAQRTVFNEGGWSAGVSPPDPDVYNVPHFAKNVCCIVGTGGPILGDVYITFYRDRAANFQTGSYYFQGADYQQRPVPNGSMYFKLFLGSTNIPPVRTVFELAI